MVVSLWFGMVNDVDTSYKNSAWHVTGQIRAISGAMAALEKLDELLNCPICLGPYSNPRILQCFHVYCQGCLAELVNRGNNTLKCPICQRVVPVPANGVAGFPAAYRITELQEIRKFFARKVKYCPAHKGRELELYCETCEDLICWRCAYRGGQHHSHDHQEVDIALEAFQGHIQPKLDRIRDKLNDLLRAVDKIQQLPGVSASKERELIKYHETVLGNIKAELTILQDRLKHLSKLAKVKKHSRREEVLLNKEKLLSALSSLEEAVQSSTLKLQEPNPWLCRLSCKGLELTSATVGEKSTVILDVISFLSVSTEVPRKSLQCALTSDGTAIAIACGIENRQGSYFITYQPVAEGWHRLSVKINNIHVRGSPYMILARPPIVKEKRSVDHGDSGRTKVSSSKKGKRARKKTTFHQGIQLELTESDELPQLRETPYLEQSNRDRRRSFWDSDGCDVVRGILFYIVLGVACWHYGFWSVVSGLLHVFVFLCVLMIHCLLLELLLGFISRHFKCFLCFCFFVLFFCALWHTRVA